MNNTYMTGLARSGKDSFAKLLAKRSGQELYALAAPIKDIMCALFGWDDEHRDGSYKEIPMVYVVTPDSLESAGMLYNQYGLDEYEEFHDCWEKLLTLFNFEVSDDFTHYTRISPRTAFQLFGTEWGRTVDDEIWLKIAPKENVIITDVRFNNEAAYFRELGAIGIKVERPYFGKIANSGHDSESGIDEQYIDTVVINDKTLEILNLKAGIIHQKYTFDYDNMMPVRV